MASWNWNSSYVYGVDNESGWGERYFFTYFSEFGERPLPVIVIEVAVLIVVFLLSIVANVTIAICVFKFPDMRTVTNRFVLNLAAADLLFAFSIPAVAYTRMDPSWKLGYFACRFIPYTQFVSGNVMLWTFSLISMDRYRCIVLPPYKSKITPTHASILAVSTWFLAAIIFIPVGFWFRQQDVEGSRTICTLVFPQSEQVTYSLCFVVPFLLLACLLPMAILVYHYARIFEKILSTRSTWASSCVMVSSLDCNNVEANRRQSEISISDIFTPWPRKFSGNSQLGSPNSRQCSLSHHEEIRLNKHVRVVRVLFLNVIVVLLMWLPITVFVILIYVDGRRSTEDTNFFLRSHYFLVALIIAFLNTVINPLLYGVLSDSFRKFLVQMCCDNAIDDGTQANSNPPTSNGKNLELSSRNGRKQSYISSSDSPNNLTV